MKQKEYKARCDKCGKRRQSRIFWRKIGGRWQWLCKECWQQEEGEKVEPIDYGVLNVMAERCNECLFSGDAIIEGDARRELIEECRERDTFFVCHKATIEGGLMVCCRGYYETHDTTPIQLANRLGLIRFVRIEELPKLNPTGRKRVTPDIAFLRALAGRPVDE